MSNNSELNSSVTYNFMKVKLWLLIPSFLLLFLIYLYFALFNDSANFIDGYVNIQKDLFLYLNNTLSEYPNLMFNLTQFGDVIISYSLVTAFIIYVPKLWEALLTSALISIVVY